MRFYVLDCQNNKIRRQAIDAAKSCGYNVPPVNKLRYISIFDGDSTQIYKTIDPKCTGHSLVPLQTWLSHLTGYNMKIGQYEVTDVKRDSVKVGCTEVTRDQIEEILKRMNTVPKQVFPEGMYPSDTDEAIRSLRDTGFYKFMEVREGSEYEAKSFFLSRNDEWRIIQDSDDAYVLIHKDDV